MRPMWTSAALWREIDAAHAVVSAFRLDDLLCAFGAQPRRIVLAAQPLQLLTHLRDRLFRGLLALVQEFNARPEDHLPKLDMVAPPRAPPEGPQRATGNAYQHPQLDQELSSEQVWYRALIVCRGAE